MVSLSNSSRFVGVARIWLAAALLASSPVLAQEAEQPAFEDDVESEFQFERTDTAIDYDIVVLGAPTEDMESLLERALLVYRRQENGAPSLAMLRRRARGDLPTVIRALRSFGFYGAEADVEIIDGADRPSDEEEAAQDRVLDEELVGDLDDEAEEERAERRAAAVERGREVQEDGASEESEDEDQEDAEDSDPATQPGDDAGAEPKPRPARVVLKLRPGAPFQLTRHDVDFQGDMGEAGPPALGPAEAYGSPVGEAAAAASIISAERAMVQDLRGSGRPYARATGRRSLADREAETLEVDTALEPGRAFVFGPIRFEGLERIEEDYLLTYLPWTEGEPVDAEQLAAYQRTLLGTNLFRAGRVTLPEMPPEGPAAPITVALEEGPRRSFNINFEWNTDDGLGIRTGFRHRNLFGSGETLIFDLDTTLGEQSGLLRYEIPQFRRRDGQLFFAQWELRNVDDDAYAERAAGLSTGIQRTIGERWTLGGAILLETSIVDDTGISGETAQLVSLPAFAAYDSSNDLLDPSEGERARLTISPTTGVWQGDGTGWLQADASASIYRPLDSDKRFIAAARSRFGSILGPDLARVPPPRRFYSGGGGSVRGLRSDFVGRADRRNSPGGGLSLVETNAEMRAHVWGSA